MTDEEALWLATNSSRRSSSIIADQLSVYFEMDGESTATGYSSADSDQTIQDAPNDSTDLSQMYRTCIEIGLTCGETLHRSQSECVTTAPSSKPPPDKVVITHF